MIAHYFYDHHQDYVEIKDQAKGGKSETWKFSKWCKRHESEREEKYTFSMSQQNAKCMMHKGRSFICR